MFLKFFFIFIFLFNFVTIYTSDFLEKLKGFILLEPVLGKLSKDRLKEIITDYSEESIKNKIRRENYLIINRFSLAAEEINKKKEKYKIFYELNKDKNFKIQNKKIVETELSENSFKLEDFFKKTTDYVNSKKKLNEKVKEAIELEIICNFLEKYFNENKKEAENLIKIEKEIENEIKTGESFKTIKIGESDFKPENYELISKYIDFRKFYIKKLHDDKGFLLSRDEENIKNNFEKVEKFFYKEATFNEWKVFYKTENPENILNSLKIFLDKEKILKEIFLNETKIKSEKRKELLSEIKSYVDKEMLYINKKRAYENLSCMAIIAFGDNFKFAFDNYYLGEYESEGKKKKVKEKIDDLLKSNFKFLSDSFEKMTDENKKSACYLFLELEYIFKKNKPKKEIENFIVNSLKKIEIKYAGVTAVIKDKNEKKENFSKFEIDPRDLNLDSNIKIFSKEEREKLIDYIEKKEYSEFLKKIFENEFFKNILISKTIKKGSFNFGDDRNKLLELKIEIYDTLFFEILGIKNKKINEYRGYYNTFDKNFNLLKDSTKKNFYFLYNNKIYFSFLGSIFYYFPNFKKKYMKDSSITYKDAFKKFLQEAAEEILLIREKVNLNKLLNYLKNLIESDKEKNDFVEKLENSSNGKSEVKLSKGIFSF